MTRLHETTRPAADGGEITASIWLHDDRPRQLTVCVRHDGGETWLPPLTVAEMTSLIEMLNVLRIHALDRLTP